MVRIWWSCRALEASLLAFVRRLTIDPAGTGMADTQAVYNVGFSEEGLYEVISATVLYNFMNRILEGAGIKCHVRALEMADEVRRR